MSRNEKLVEVQKAIVELLSPLTDDPNCLGMKVFFCWQLEGTKLGTTGVEFPSVHRDVDAQIAVLLRQAADGMMEHLGEYLPQRTVRN